MHKIALLVLYNHRYDKNISRIEDLYKGKFSYIYHLIPFYDGEKENVISVYESSYQFQSYISQAYQQIKKSKEEYTHYFVVADDILLNPLITEQNIFDFLNIDKETCYIRDLRELQKQQQCWSKVLYPFWYKMDKRGVEVKNILPDYEYAISRFNYHHIDTSTVKFKYLFGYMIWYLKKRWVRKFFLSIATMLKSRKLVYPLVWAYSDCLLLPAKVMPKFAMYCGAFAATDLFVEFAIPTSLILSADKIVTDKDIGLKGIMTGVNEIEEQYKFDLNNLINNYPDNTIFIHPIKLSKWK